MVANFITHPILCEYLMHPRTANVPTTDPLGIGLFLGTKENRNCLYVSFITEPKPGGFAFKR